MTKIGKQNFGNVTPNEVESSIAKNCNVRGSMMNLLVSQNKTMEDKIATIKTAQLIDKGQFENALKTLMKR